MAYAKYVRVAGERGGRQTERGCVRKEREGCTDHYT